MVQRLNEKDLKTLTTDRNVPEAVRLAARNLGFADVLLDVFPGALIIQTHRDPIESIPSLASMITALWSLVAERVDPQEVARQWSAKMARETSERFGQGNPKQGGDKQSQRRPYQPQDSGQKRRESQMDERDPQRRGQSEEEEEN